MRVLFEGNRKHEEPPVVTFDLQDGSVCPMVKGDGNAMSCGSSNGEDFLDECVSQKDSTDTTLRDTASASKEIQTHPLGHTAQSLKEAVFCLYVLLTVGTTLLVYFLADDSCNGVAETEDAGETEPFDIAFFYIHPLVFTLLVAAVFSLVGGLAYAYHSILIKKLEDIDRSAQQSKAIVSSFFPAQFCERLLQSTPTATCSIESQGQIQGISPPEDNGTNISVPDMRDVTPIVTNKTHLKNYLQGSHSSPTIPIADLFLNCTVLFADVVGFTGWSSEREPTQVFLLLESLFSTFDQIAKRLKVFKVESIGDCYIAVAGLPDPQKDHAVRMVRFARLLMQRMTGVVKQLERSLGPETGDLRLRIGIHSGPVTAGVLRGERCKFQLFGDTVDTASCMETTSEKNRIQLSSATAELLIRDGKESWITERAEMVEAKGKGTIQTFWALLRNAQNHDSSVSGHSCSSRTGSMGLAERQTIGWDAVDSKGCNLILALPPMSRSAKNKRLVEWNVDMLTSLLKRLVAQRNPEVANQCVEDPNTTLQKRGETPYDEVIEAIELPTFCADKSGLRDPELVQLGPKVVSQLTAFVSQIADGYRDNPFHNFEHASHVTMSVHKLLNRVVTPKEVDCSRDDLDIGMEVHNYTYGITSDALSQFGIVFSALIHDVEHPGVSNAQWAEENPELGEKYKNKSVAEQNSVDVAWGLLMQPEYKDLQQCIFTNEAELHRFRSTIVNSVLATDIFEPGQKKFRNERWDKAFHSDLASSSKAFALSDDTINLRATIVIEHIIQASDVSHTMQDWSIYQKWNEKLFRELFLAYDEGRSTVDPSQGWYKGELWFYDNYVIPLAKKLAECKVFGVSSDESLNYALANRKVWAEKGEQVVAEMVDRYKKRKELEIGGLTQDEISSFTPQDLEYIMKKLIEKGRSNGTRRVDAVKGQNDAAQAWMDALEVYERAPAALEIRDCSIAFPVYSGIHVWLKGGKIQNDENGYFEQNLARKFVRESKRYHKDRVHYYRAMAMLCEVTAASGDYKTALDLLEYLKSTYDTKIHSLGMEKIYGVDRAACAIGMSAMWLNEMGEVEEALNVCDYVVTTLLPILDGTNTLGMFELLVPVLMVLKQHGKANECYDLFNEYVHEAFLKNHGPDAFTPTKSLHKPMAWLFAMLKDRDNFSDFEEAVEWLTEGDNGTPNDFLDNIIIRTSWGPSDMAAELCLLVAQKLRERNEEGDMENCKTIAGKGLRLSRLADGKIKDVNGAVLHQFANRLHAPVMSELEALTKAVGVFSEAAARTALAPGVKVNLPRSYLVAPVSAAAELV